ncbi:MAG: FeoA family protein [Chitinophagales bacterium]
MNQNHSVVRLGKLKEGETGVIVELEKGDLSLKLMELGFLPGERIFVDKIAPLGDPISVKIGSYLLSLRKEEANAVIVRK